MTQNKRWLIPPVITPSAEQALAAVTASPLLKQILFNRGYATQAEALAYLRAEPNFNTDPLQMTGMRATVDRIVHALEHHERLPSTATTMWTESQPPRFSCRHLRQWMAKYKVTFRIDSTKVTASITTHWIISKRRR